MDLEKLSREWFDNRHLVKHLRTYSSDQMMQAWLEGAEAGLELQLQPGYKVVQVDPSKFTEADAQEFVANIRPKLKLIQKEFVTEMAANFQKMVESEVERRLRERESGVGGK